MSPISQRSKRIDSSGIRKVFDLARSLKVVNLSSMTGDVPDAVKQAGIQAIQDGYNGYTPTQGLCCEKRCKRPSMPV